MNFSQFLTKIIFIEVNWGLGIGDWGLGIGDWAQSPIPNPQAPIPNPQIRLHNIHYKKIKFINYFKKKIKCLQINFH